MGDMGDVFREMKAHSKEKRQFNRDNAPKMLEEAGISFSSHNEGAHLIVIGKYGSFDFWPGTGRWIQRGGGKLAAGYGIRSLIKLLKGDK